MRFNHKKNQNNYYSQTSWFLKFSLTQSHPCTRRYQVSFLSFVPNFRSVIPCERHIYDLLYPANVLVYPTSTICTYFSRFFYLWFTYWSFCSLGTLDIYIYSFASLLDIPATYRSYVIRYLRALPLAGLIHWISITHSHFTVSHLTSKH